MYRGTFVPRYFRHAKYRGTMYHGTFSYGKTPRTVIPILQVSINGITYKQEDLKQLAHTTQTDIIIRNTKLTTTSKTPKITNYTFAKIHQTKNRTKRHHTQ